MNRHYEEARRDMMAAEASDDPREDWIEHLEGQLRIARGSQEIERIKAEIRMVKTWIQADLERDLVYAEGEERAEIIAELERLA